MQEKPGLETQGRSPRNRCGMDMHMFSIDFYNVLIANSLWKLKFERVTENNARLSFPVILLFFLRMKVPARPLLLGLGAVLALGAEHARHLAQVVLPVREVAIVLVWTVAFL